MTANDGCLSPREVVSEKDSFVSSPCSPSKLITTIQACGAVATRSLTQVTHNSFTIPSGSST